MLLMLLGSTPLISLIPVMINLYALRVRYACVFVSALQSLTHSYLQAPKRDSDRRLKQLVLMKLLILVPAFFVAHVIIANFLLAVYTHLSSGMQGAFARQRVQPWIGNFFLSVCGSHKRCQCIH